MKRDEINQTSYTTSIVFIFTISIVIISLVSVIFPALIISNNSFTKELKQYGISVLEIHPLVTGPLALPLVLINGTILIISVLFWKKKIPDVFDRGIRLILNFEVGRKTACIIIGILLLVYIVSNISDLSREETWEDYLDVKNRAENWSIQDAVNNFDVPVRFFLLSSSLSLFDNIRILPFFASISLLLVTYFITVQISKKKFAGIVAFAILLQSHVFLAYDTTATYENFWILFYVFSLFLITKFWQSSPAVYIISVLSKPLTILFLPATIFFVLKASISKRRKGFILLLYATIISISVIVLFSMNFTIYDTTINFNNDRFLQGFTSMSYQLRFDWIVLFFLFPLSIGLFALSRKGFKQCDFILVLIGVTLLSAPVLTGFTEITNQPYRFVSLVVFFAIGVGTILSKNLSVK